MKEDEYRSQSGGGKIRINLAFASENAALVEVVVNQMYGCDDPVLLFTAAYYTPAATPTPQAPLHAAAHHAVSTHPQVRSLDGPMDKG